MGTGVPLGLSRCTRKQTHATHTHLLTLLTREHTHNSQTRWHCSRGSTHTHTSHTPATQLKNLPTPFTREHIHLKNWLTMLARKHTQLVGEVQRARPHSARSEAHTAQELADTAHAGARTHSSRTYLWSLLTHASTMTTHASILTCCHSGCSQAKKNPRPCRHFVRSEAQRLADSVTFGSTKTRRHAGAHTAHGRADNVRSQAHTTQGLAGTVRLEAQTPADTLLARTRT